MNLFETGAGAARLNFPQTFIVRLQFGASYSMDAFIYANLFCFSMTAVWGFITYIGEKLDDPIKQFIVKETTLSTLMSFPNLFLSSYQVTYYFPLISLSINCVYQLPPASFTSIKHRTVDII